MTVSESCAALHVTVMSACSGWSSVCAESVHFTVDHCARVALVITVGSDAQQLSEHQVRHARRNDNGTQPVLRALDVRASNDVTHVPQTTQDHGFVS